MQPTHRLRQVCPTGGLPPVPFRGALGCHAAHSCHGGTPLSSASRGDRLGWVQLSAWTPACHVPIAAEQQHLELSMSLLAPLRPRVSCGNVSDGPVSLSHSFSPPGGRVVVSMPCPMQEPADEKKKRAGMRPA